MTSNGAAAIRTNTNARRLLLVGGGHSHLPVLAAVRDWPSSIEVTLVSPDALTAYSGMVPGVIAGHYPAAACLIDVQRLAQSSNVRFIAASAVALDPGQRRVTLDNGSVLDYDLLSIDVGATPRVPDAMREIIATGVCGALTVAPCKPFPLLIERFERFVSEQQRRAAPIDLCVVGAGIAGIEIALALASRFRGEPPARVRLLAGDERLLPVGPRRIGRALERACADAGVEVLARTRIMAIEPPGVLVAADGRRISAQLALVATGASAPAWLAGSGLAIDDAGFVSVGATLASRSHQDVFAAGDCASVLEHPRPKAGVYAVRQGPPLAHNLLRALRGEPLQPFAPQRSALALVALGPQRAIAIRNGVAIGGAASAPMLGARISDLLARRLWVWKDRIDRTFVTRYSG
jgi:selenide, water dikinase